MKKPLVLAVAEGLLLLGTATAADPPFMKDGYWSLHRQMTENPGGKKTESTQSICTNRAYQEYVRNLAKNQKGCKMLVDNYTGATYTQESECVVGETTIHSKGVTTIQGDSGAHMESRSTNSPALYGVSETITVMDQKFLGACPAGIQPGDIVRANGSKTNSWKH
jgi:Protein of unknown function (DUF3617)